MNLVQQSLPFLPEALLTLPARQRVRMAVLRMAMHRSCRRARLVVVQTATMRSAVASAFGIPQNRIAVVEPVPEPVAPTSGAPELACMRSAPPGRRLLYVGNDSPYKNLAVLEAALPALRERFPDLRLFATLPEGHPLVRVAGVERLGYLRPDVLAEAYELATALVLPSLAETVGLPMLEAAMAGAPVLAADRPYAREVCPAGSLFFDPLRADDLVEATTRLVSSQTLRAELGAAGRALLARRGAVRPYDRLIELCLQAALAAPETPLRVV